MTNPLARYDDLNRVSMPSRKRMIEGHQGITIMTPPAKRYDAAARVANYYGQPLPVYLGEPVARGFNQTKRQGA